MSARTFAVDSGGVSRFIKKWFAIDSGGVARFAKRVFIVDSGSVSRLIFATQVTAIASPTSCFASGPSGTFTTNTTTVTATGGIPPYSYSWALSATSGPTITITNPTGATTAFSAHISSGQTAEATGTCTVTDSIGDQALPSVGVIITSTA